MEDIKQLTFEEQLTDTCKSHFEWIQVMRFGMGTLIKKQSLLMQLVSKEAEREIARNVGTRRTMVEETLVIFSELKLKIEVA